MKAMQPSANRIPTNVIARSIESVTFPDIRPFNDLADQRRKAKPSVGCKRELNGAVEFYVDRPRMTPSISSIR
jgi:hypothetical protein